MSWMQKPKYSVKEQLPKIVHHEKLPPGSVEIGRIIDPNNSNKIIVLARQGKHVSILRADIAPRLLKNGKLTYVCGQADFPLGTLCWLSSALIEFCKPPIQGGLPVGAMTSADEDVEGEMLCIERAMNAGSGFGGYIIVNKSRKDRLVKLENHFEPQEATFADNLLYEAGLLDLIKNLGEKYSRGEI